MPTVAAVATEEPQTAENSVQAPMLECISPPGSQDSQCVMAAYMRSAMPARSRISPSRMNIGIATRITSVVAPQASSPSASLSGRKE